MSVVLISQLHDKLSIFKFPNVLGFALLGGLLAPHNDYHKSFTVLSWYYFVVSSFCTLGSRSPFISFMSATEEGDLEK